MQSMLQRYHKKSIFFSKGIIGVPVVVKELAVCGSMLQKHHILVNTRKEIEFKVTLLFLMTYQPYKMFEEWSRIIFRLHQTYSYYQR